MCILREHLHRILLLARIAEYPSNSMLVSGIDTLTDIYAMMQNESHCYLFTAKLVISFLPCHISFGKRVLEVLRNFDNDELSFTLILMLEACVNLKSQMRRDQPYLFRHVRPDLNVKKIITDSEENYANEFDIIIQNYNMSDSDSDSSSDSNSDSDSEDALHINAEMFNEWYQELAPPRERQLDRLTNELNIRLCEACLYPYNGQECDCWLDELGESYFSK